MKQVAHGKGIEEMTIPLEGYMRLTDQGQQSKFSLAGWSFYAVIFLQRRCLQ